MCCVNICRKQSEEGICMAMATIDKFVYIVLREVGLALLYSKVLLEYAQRCCLHLLVPCFLYNSQQYGSALCRVPPWFQWRNPSREIRISIWALAV